MGYNYARIFYESRVFSLRQWANGVILELPIVLREQGARVKSTTQRPSQNLMLNHPETIHINKIDWVFNWGGWNPAVNHDGSEDETTLLGIYTAHRYDLEATNPHGAKDKTNASMAVAHMVSSKRPNSMIPPTTPTLLKAKQDICKDRLVLFLTTNTPQIS